MSKGRANQRRRTRTAIVNAAMTLLARGDAPSVADVADAAEVSRRTVYMHFPTLDHLLLDATAGVLSQAIDARFSSAAMPDDVETRVEMLARSVQRMSPEVERLGRALIRLTAERPDDHSASSRAAHKPIRGYRRVHWIEQALAPLRAQVDAPRYERLVSALAMVIGWEAMIVQRDIRGLSRAQSEELSVWAAQALLRATLEEQPARRRR